jgi:hypothetical protein
MSKTIVAFHIGKGGRFWNPGHVSYIGKHEIGYFTDDLFCHYQFETEYRNIYSDYPNIIESLENFFDVGDGETSQDIMDKYPIFRRLNIKLKDLGVYGYYDGSGNYTGLTQLEYESGVGSINIDGEYDTTYTKYIDDCDKDEMLLIINSDPYDLSELMKEAGYSEYEIFNSFNCISEMLDGYSLKYCDIEEISEDEYNDDEYGYKKINDKYYRN